MDTSHHMGRYGFCVTVLTCCRFLLLFLFMEKLRVGTLNINGGRDRNKRAVVREFLNIKTLTWSFYKRPIVTKKTRQNGGCAGKINSHISILS